MPWICQEVYTDPDLVAREPTRGRPAWIAGTLCGTAWSRRWGLRHRLIWIGTKCAGLVVRFVAWAEEVTRASGKGQGSRTPVTNTNGPIGYIVKHLINGEGLS
jgi:hypothetical protein